MDPEAREKIALRIIAFSFFGLALYVTGDAIRSLFGFGEAQHSPVGIGLAAASLVIMPVLSYAQRRTGRELGSLSAVADSKQTLLCTYLSAILLVGLLLNSLFGWSWADPIAALGIAVIAVREGINAWKGDTCCPSLVNTKTAAGEENCDCCDD
jgi:divalent metal cation (Fe/Co/Zn/Cd) transporter